MRFVTARVIAGALLLAACGGGHSQTDTQARAAAFFMKSNARQAGVVSLPSGVQYKILARGPSGGPHPDSNDLVSVFYEGALTNGQVFDSSFDRGMPYVTPLDQVVPGWTDALTRMRPGDEWLIYIPPELGYGAEGRPPTIPGNSVLVFRVKLMAVAGQPGVAERSMGRG